MEKITQDQFEKIVDLHAEMQRICPSIDTSSISMWLTMVPVKKEEKEKVEKNS